MGGARENVLFDLHALLAHALLIQHVVGLVNNEDPELSWIELASTDGIHDSARCADNNGAPNPRCSVNSAGHSGLNDEIGDELAHGLDNVLDLTRQLSGGGQEECLGLVWFAVVDPRQDGNNERGGLSSTGLRLGNHVAGRVGQKQGQSLLLDLGGLLEVHGEKALVDAFGAAQSVNLGSADGQAGVTDRLRSSKVFADERGLSVSTSRLDTVTSTS